MRGETSSRPCERGLLRGPGDALLVVDVQRDFLPDGTLAVTDGAHLKNGSSRSDPG